MVEKPLLSEKDVMAAERLEGDFANHPVIRVLDAHLGEINDFNKGYFPTEVMGRQNYVRMQGGFLIDALMQVESYDLDPLSLIAVWSRAVELFPKKVPGQHSQPPYHRYGLAEMVSTVFSVQEIEGSKWKQLPYVYLRNMKLPEGVEKDRSTARQVFDRLEVVRLGVREVEDYIGGMRVDFNDLLERAHKQDKEALQRLNLFSENVKRRSTPATSQVVENFGNAMMHVRSLVGCLAAVEHF